MLSFLPVLLALVAASAGCDSGGATDAPPDYRILFVGNSLTYTNDLPTVLAELVEESDAGRLEVKQVVGPNVGLEDHWSAGLARAEIAKGNWDVVVVQQGPSATEGRPSLIEYSKRYAAEASAVGARLAVFMVWPSSERSFDFPGVSDAHQAAADGSGSLLFPAGEAWLAAWRRKSSLRLYGDDGFHPSRMGTYLAALVMFEQITGRSPVGAPAVVDGIGAADLRILQESAAEANRNFARP